MKTLSKLVAVSAVALLLSACGKQEETATTGEAATPPAESSGQGTGVAGLPLSTPSAQDSPAGGGTPPEYGGGTPSAGGTVSSSGGAMTPEQEKEKSEVK
ncbi:MAG: hypothetical protein AB1830_16000 [Pseudomonadota bacterium]